MYSSANQLLEALNEIKGNGSFVFTDKKEFIFPEFFINKTLEISFPILSSQVKEMIKIAHKAPFGKGMETILDTKVRSAWEIDADKISFKNDNWSKLLATIVEDVKVGLAIEKQTVSANLYKLLIYEKGDFFVAHKDSEKEPGMFGTLIVGLPSKHDGGKLLVRFDGKEEEIDFSEPSNLHNFPYTAFFADCEHEIKPITAGYRVCLVYNLVQKKTNQKIQPTQVAGYVNNLSKLLSNHTNEDSSPTIILLGHQYTPENFSLDTLKQHDRPRADALIKAAEKAGFYAKLGLVTCYIMGDLIEKRSSYSRRNRYYDYDDDDVDLENSTMGDDIYENHEKIEHWAVDGTPALKNIKIDEDDLITDIVLKEGEPTEKEGEGYTGNAGMTMEYWYHYGAVVLWEKSKHFDLLNRENLSTKLEWIDYYLDSWHKILTTDQQKVKTLIANFSQDEIAQSPYGYHARDFSGIANFLIKINDEKFLMVISQSIVAKIFSRIPPKHWTELINIYGAKTFETIFQDAAREGKVENIKHILEILQGLIKPDFEKHILFVTQQIEQMPNYLLGFDLIPNDGKNYRSDRETDKTQVKKIVANLLKLSNLKNFDKNWLNNAINSLTKAMPRTFVNDVLVAALLENDSYKNLNLAKRLFEVCKQDLTQRKDDKPMPPADWSRDVPSSDYARYSNIWKILTPFLESPAETVFDYRKVQAERSEMESAIGSVTIDLKKETITKGSPHTLRLTKTQDAYKNELKMWKIDVELLEKLESLY